MKTFLSLHSYTLLTSGLSYCSTLTNTAFTLSYCCTLTCSADLWPRHTLITQPEAGAEVRVSAGVDSDCGICATAVEVCSRVWWVAHPAQTCTTTGVTCNTGMLRSGDQQGALSVMSCCWTQHRWEQDRKAGCVHHAVPTSFTCSTSIHCDS